MKIRTVLLSAVAAVSLTACGGGGGGSGVPAATCKDALNGLSTSSYAVSSGNGTMLWNSAAATYQVVSNNGYSGSPLAHDLLKLEKATRTGSTSGAVTDLKAIYASCGGTYAG